MIEIRLSKPLTVKFFCHIRLMVMAQAQEAVTINLINVCKLWSLVFVIISGHAGGRGMTFRDITQSLFLTSYY